MILGCCVHVACEYVHLFAFFLITVTFLNS